MALGYVACIVRTGLVEAMISPVDRTEDLVRALAERHSIDLSAKGSRQRVLKVKPADEDGGDVECGNEAIRRARALWKAMQDSRGMLTRAAEDYGNFGPAGMTDAERDAVDRAVGQFVAHALKEIEQLKKMAVTRVSARDARHASEAAHLLGIVALLSDGLQDLSAAGQRLRDLRIRQALAARKRPQRVAYDAAAARELAKEEAARKSVKMDDMGTPADGDNRGDDGADLADDDVSGDVQLMQQLARENVTLVNDLVETRERVQEAERTVYAIANMNQVFATKVLEQAREIETLYNLAVEASTFTERGNRELRKLEKKGHSVKYLLAAVAFFLALTLLVAERVTRWRRLI